MALTIDDVKQKLRADEPEYKKLANEWGAEALPFLAELAKSQDVEVRIGPRAVYLAGKIAGPDAATIVGDAAKHVDPVWRIAAAGAAEYLPDVERARIVSILLKDADVGVRRFALDATPDRVDTALKQMLEHTAQNDPVDGLRQLAQDVIARIRND